MNGSSRACAALVVLTLGVSAPLTAQETTRTDTARSDTARAAAAQPVSRTSTRITDDLLKPIKARLIGPANTSGRVTAMAFPTGSNGKVMYAGFASGGVFKTTNHGVTWKPISDDIGFASIGDVAVAPSNDQIVWIGTGERNSLRSNGWGDGVYKSTNGGGKWERMPLEGMSHIGRLAIHPKNPDIVYVASMGHLWSTSPERGVYKTTDGGTTWEKTLFVNDTVAFVDLKMDPSNPEVLYAAGWHRIRRGGGTMEGAGDGSGIWKTTNGGKSWTELTAPDGSQSGPMNARGLPTAKLGRIGIDVHPKNPKLVYAIIQAATGSTNAGVSPFGGFFRSTDGGASWTRMNDLSAVPDYYYNEVWLDPNDENHVFLAGTYLAETKDGGATFKNMDLGNVHVDHHSMWIDPADSDHIILGNDGGLYISWDKGQNWEHLQHPVTQAYQISIDSTRAPYHVCVGLQDNGVWCGPSATRERSGITPADWYTVYGGDGFYSEVSPDSSVYRYAEYQFGNLARWNVDEWKYETLVPHPEDAGAEAGYAFRFDWDAPFLISKHDPKTLYFGSNHLFRLRDRGRGGWEILGPDMTRQNRIAPEPDTGYTGYHALHSIAESNLDRNLLWTGSDDGLLWVSTDAGKTWRNVTEAIPDAEARRCWVAEIEPSRFHRETAYVVYDCHNRGNYQPYVFRTTDLGRSFIPITGNLPRNGGSYVIRESATNPRFLFVGTEQGLFFSNQGGNDWKRFKNGLPVVAVRDMDIFVRETDLAIATFGRSVYILDTNVLEQLSDSVLAAPAHLFPVEDARRIPSRDIYESFGDAYFTAENPPQGAEIAYHLSQDLGKDAALTIRRVVDGKPEGEPVMRLTGSGRPGLHMVRWDMRQQQPRARELGGPTNANELREVPAGTYEVTLTAGDAKLSRTFDVLVGWPEPSMGRIR